MNIRYPIYEGVYRILTMVYYDAVAVGGTFYTLKRAVEQKKKFANVCYNRR